jgi:lipopolysaccharide/colanic/teichoic acid biosynthesis glycosyltransferase
VLVEAPLGEIDLRLPRLYSERRIRLLALLRPSYGLALVDPVVRLGGLPWLRLGVFPLQRRRRLAKRALDLGLVIACVPLLLPLVALTALAVVLSSPGGILYRQTRVGKGGRHFVLFKLRTMRPGAEDETGPVLAGPDDPRVTPLGRVLRRYRLDELPQLWNVVRGDMSLVGPRPERPELAAEFCGIKDYELRHLLPPGLTGLAQLAGGYSATAEDKLRCDLLYLSSHSVWLDLRLIARTALEFFRGFPGG